MQILLLTFCFAAQAYAADENLKITTYYPSPEGEYKNLKVTEDLKAKKIEASDTLKVSYGDTSAGNMLVSDGSGTGKAQWQAPAAGGKPTIIRYTSTRQSSSAMVISDVYGVASGSNLGPHDACMVEGFRVTPTPISHTTFMRESCILGKKTDGTWLVSYTDACDFTCLTW